MQPLTKDSLIYSHDTFLKNLTSRRTQKLTQAEESFVNFLYLRLGKILLLGLFFLFSRASDCSPQR
jgi:hypothetical protein